MRRRRMRSPRSPLPGDPPAASNNPELKPLTMLRAVARRYGSLQDVVETEHILHADLGFPLPLVWAILEDAECWIHAIVHRSKVIKIHGENFDVEEEEAALYCIARLPLGAKEYKPLRRIVFTIEAHDQGPRIPLWPATGSWTWFEADTGPGQRQLIVRNVPADKEWHTYRIQWDYSPHDKVPKDAALHEWMGSVTRGQQIGVFARAEHQGWVNVVRSVSVEVYCAYA
ncbi:hypothetical protein FOMPIDRAFT_1062622 [Fomitopsis schrenkii]|uniref:Uncharacterized protein n=1 Tax=Fomitopsis schrenkii TaxID=2126942 RepID=S8DSK7_FOMSC|nr:hypothetical protein FOMPIDRAFT_1062622 [Fomitopsis schrenkii]